MILLASTGFSRPIPAPVFGNHMVLQRDMPVAVWGTATPGEKVTASFSGKIASAVTDSTGKWRLRLDPLPANNKPETMIISSDSSNSEVSKIEDVLVGEVWLGSGQSNMAMIAQQIFGNGILSNSIPPPKPGELPPDPNLKALIDAAPYPEIRLIKPIVDNKTKEVKVEWVPSDRDNLIRFSAQLQCFGVILSKKLNVPVGLMLAAYGGTPSSRWVTPAQISVDPGCQRELAKANATFSIEKATQAYQEAVKKYETDLVAWNQLSDVQKKEKEKLAPRKPNPVIKPGEATRSEWPVGDFHDLLLAPFIGYTIRGVLWDQGESGAMISGIAQNTLMGALIRGWRQEWGQDKLPFLYVQKPSGGGCAFDYTDKILSWASDHFQPLPDIVNQPGEGRLTNQMLASYPDTHMIQTSDLGGGIHPVNKFGYASRDVQVALGTVYGQPVETSGPVFEKSQIEGDKIRISFTHTGAGLVFRNGEKLQGFAVAGDDKKFVWADAVIDGKRVVVSSQLIPKPIYVRYGWGQAIPWANLFNQDGFPALTFKTDP